MGLKKPLKWALHQLGYTINRRGDQESVTHDMDSIFKNIFERSRPFSQTKMAAMYSLYSAVQHVVESGVRGDFVECGVWRGGSSMAAALSFLAMEDTSRNIWLYDTYSGMDEPSSNDANSYDGTPAYEIWNKSRHGTINSWNYSPLDEVVSNLSSTGYPKEKLKFVEGKVEDTIPNMIPSRISILRLDTDFYHSTYHELEHLFPLLSEGGFLIIDDYGTWTGSRQATERYLKENQIHIFFNRIDEGVRLGQKLGFKGSI